VRDGFITAQDARRDYGVVIDAEGRLDSAATERLRSSRPDIELTSRVTESDPK
jgi:hypothetical protein